MIGFVILHYLTSEYTIKSVDSIKKNVKENKVIVIVDNASPNDSLKVLEDKYDEDSEVKIIHLSENQGFARGNNAGYKFLKNNFDFKYIVVMNNDVLITQKDFYGKVDKSYQTNRFYILGPDVYSIRDNRHQNPVSRKNFTMKDLNRKKIIIKIKLYFRFLIFIKWKLIEGSKSKHSDINQISKDNYDPNIEKNTILHGSIYIFSKDFINREDKAFYDKTFMYMESYILQYQALKKKYLMIYDPTIKVLHYEDVSTDISVKNKYNKAIFTLNCLLDSTNVFITLMNENKNDR